MAPATMLATSLLNTTGVEGNVGVLTSDIQKYFDMYALEIQYSSCLRPATIRGYTAVFNLFLRVMPEANNLASLTPSLLNEYFKRIEERPRIVGKGIKSGVKRSTISTHFAKLNVFFKWLFEHRYIEENPLKKIKRPQVNYDDYKRLDDDDIRRLYSSITIYSANPFMLRRDTVMVSLLLYCGIRKSELLGLEIRDVDLGKKLLTVRGETSKSKKTRLIPINPALQVHLQDYLEKRKLRKVFTSKLIVSHKEDRGLTEDGLKHWVKRMIEKTGVKFHVHQFRHTFACILAEKNINLFKIMGFMGHTDANMTKKYMRSLQTENMMNDIAQISF